MNNKIKKKVINPVGLATTNQEGGNFNQASPGLENRGDTQESYEYPDWTACYALKSFNL